MSEPDLGDCIAEYKTSLRGFATLGVIMLASFAVAGLLIWFSVHSADKNVGGRVIFFFFGLLFSLPGLLGVYGFTRGRKNALRFHEHGLAIHKAGNETRLRWEEIASYSVGAFLVIETASGAAFDFGMDGLANGAEVGTRLRDEVTVRRAVPLLHKEILEGNTVEFEGAEVPAETERVANVALAAGFALDMRGITLSRSDRVIPWGEITGCGTTLVDMGTRRVDATVTLVFVTSTVGNYHVAIEPESDREELTALCRELSPRLAPRRA